MSSSSKNTSESSLSRVREGWLLDAPSYEGGVLATSLYDAGTGLSQDSAAADGERSYMMCISNTSQNEFIAYTEKLVRRGYVLDSENTMDAPRYSGLVRQTNLYRQYRKDNKLLYVYFNAAIDQVRVIEDHASIPESEFEYSFGYNGDTPVDVCMYGMKYHPKGLQFSDPGGDPDTANNGSFFIIRQADNSVILIDGGARRQVTDISVEGLWSFLHQITEKEENEPITVACWFVSHPHEDHYSLVYALLEKYHEQIDLQRVMFNFPNPTAGGQALYEFRGNIDCYFPNAKFLKCHTGQSIHLGSIGVAHHGFNDVADAYKAANATYALWTNYSHENFPHGIFASNKWRYERAKEMISALNEGAKNAGANSCNIYYAGKNTAKLACVNGNNWSGIGCNGRSRSKKIGGDSAKPFACETA